MKGVISMRKIAQLILAGSALFAMASLSASSLAQAQGRAKCSPVGTWYGGSEGTAKYIASITPIDENRFNIVWSGAFSLAQLGFPVATLIPGEFKQERHGQWDYEGTAGGFGETSDAFPPAAYPDLWVVHYRIQLEGCNTMIVRHDFFGGYTWASNKTPFVDQPDYPVAPTPIVETYKRLPGKCPICVD
jgi:hypothetical protein